MALTLEQSDALTHVAGVLRDFLPGSGDRSWKGHVTFGSVAATVGVGDYWSGGSKQKALVQLLSLTLEQRPTLFQKLIVEIVRAGLTYRRERNPVTKAEILDLNDLIRKLGFKFPELWNPVFLDGLAARHQPAPETVPITVAPDLAEHRRRLGELREHFYALSRGADRNAAGTAFQTLFHDLLQLFGLKPKPAYRVTGEEIDGHFLLDNETYLIETKWEAGPLSEAPLLVFRGKIEGRSNVSRGVFVAVNGFTDACLAAIRIGKQPNFFLLDGYDVVQVIEGRIELPTLLREKLRLFAAKGAVFARVEAT